MPDRVDVLQNGSIRFTQPEYLNDPFEIRPQIEQLLSDVDIKEIFDKLNSPKQKNKVADEVVAQHLAKMLSEMQPKQRKAFTSARQNMLRAELKHRLINSPDFSKIYAEYLTVALPIIKEGNMAGAKRAPEWLNDVVGVLSLTEEPDNDVMWAHYAANHSGFVLEFDSSHPFFDFPNRLGASSIKKVVYKEPAVLPYISADNVDDLFYIKKVQWAYEQEWRVLRVIESADASIDLPDSTKIRLFALPPDCITGVIFGARMSDADKARVLEVLRGDRYRHINIYQARIGSGAIEIEAVEVER